MFPFSYIKNKEELVLDDTSIPYWKYTIIETSFFGKPTVKALVLRNMITGEATTYSPDTLHEYAN